MNKLLTCLALSALLAPIVLSAGISKKYTPVLDSIADANSYFSTETDSTTTVYAKDAAITYVWMINRLRAVLEAIKNTYVLDNTVNGKLQGMIYNLDVALKSTSDRIRS